MAWRHLLPGVLLVVALGGCGLSTHVRPTPHRTVAIESAVGGPVARLPAPIPLPLLTAGASYGVAERLDVSAHTHLTTLAAFGLAGLDVGSHALVVDQQGRLPAVTVGLVGYGFTRFQGGALFFLDANATASWRLFETWLAFFDLTGQWDFADRAVRWAPAVGVRKSWSHVDLQLDLRWYEPTYDTRPSSVAWLGPFKHGALGVVIGVGYRL